MVANISNIQQVYNTIPSRFIFEDVTYDNYQLLTDLHYNHGWRNVIIPEINQFQILGNDYILIDDIITKLVIDLTPEEIAEANKPIVPQTARSMNFRLVLIQNGISMQSVYDLINSLPTPQNQLAYQMFEYATHYDRNNAMINGLAQMMGISQEQLDDFFIQSENLVV